MVVHDAGVEADGSGGDANVAQAVADEIGGEACVENLETEDGCRRTVEFALERFGRLDAVIQNAGLNIWEELEEAAPRAGSGCAGSSRRAVPHHAGRLSRS